MDFIRNKNMKTLTTYKIVFVDGFGDLQEFDFETENEARGFAANNNITDFMLYEVKIMGSITKL